MAICLLQLNSEFVVGYWDRRINPWKVDLFHREVDPVMEALFPMFIVGTIMVGVYDKGLPSLSTRIGHDQVIGLGQKILTLVGLLLIAGQIYAQVGSGQGLSLPLSFGEVWWVLHLALFSWLRWLASISSRFEEAFFLWFD